MIPKLDMPQAKMNEIVLRLCRANALARVGLTDTKKVSVEMFGQAWREVAKGSWWDFNTRAMVSTAEEKDGDLWLHPKVDRMQEVQTIFDPQNRPVHYKLEEGRLRTSVQTVHLMYRKAMEPCQCPMYIMECVTCKLALILAASYAPSRVNDLKAWYYHVQKWAVWMDRKVDLEKVEQPGVNDIGFLMGYYEALEQGEK